jgi:hypothetical protein
MQSTLSSRTSTQNFDNVRCGAGNFPCGTQGARSWRWLLSFFPAWFSTTRGWGWQCWLRARQVSCADALPTLVSFFVLAWWRCFAGGLSSVTPPLCAGLAACAGKALRLLSAPEQQGGLLPALHTNASVPSRLPP